ncbi:choice-of-anchor I family protein [Eionea flava]
MRYYRCFFSGALIAASTLISVSSTASDDFTPRHRIAFSETVSPITLKKLGTYDSGLIDESAAEIVAHDPRSQRVFVTNAKDSSVDVLSIYNPRRPHKLFSLDLSAYGEPNSVAVNKGIVAVAVAANDVGVEGKVVFFNRHGRLLNALDVGFLPDMLTFSPDGKTLVVANEGEPNDDYTIDPEGTVSIISIQKPIKKMTRADVKTADFTAFNSQTLDDSVRIFGPNASVAQDVEPEYVAISDDSQTAYVALQENNAYAIVDLPSAQVTDIVGLGVKSFDSIYSAMDASDKDDAVAIQPWPVKGFYQPDSIASYTVDGETYLVTANEGDARDYDGYSEEVRVDDLILDPSLLARFPSLQDEDQLGRLKTTTANGDLDNDGDVDQIFAYGGRSFSIFNANTGELVFDSGADFARITANLSAELFNANDKRSDDKGAEPEALTIGKVGKRTYAFIGLERTGGVMIYDITRPETSHFVHYANNSLLDGDVDAGTAGDVAPEGFAFISAKHSPIRQPLLVVANEVSGTTTLYAIETVADRRWKGRR